MKLLLPMLALLLLAACPGGEDTSKSTPGKAKAGGSSGAVGDAPANPCQTPKASACVLWSHDSKVQADRGAIISCEGGEVIQHKKAIALGKKTCDSRKGDFIAAGHCPSPDRLFSYVEWWRLPGQDRWQTKVFRIFCPLMV